MLFWSFYPHTNIRGQRLRMLATGLWALPISLRGQIYRIWHYRGARRCFGECGPTWSRDVFGEIFHGERLAFWLSASLVREIGSQFLNYAVYGKRFTDESFASPFPLDRWGVFSGLTDWRKIFCVTDANVVILKNNDKLYILRDKIGMPLGAFVMSG